MSGINLRRLSSMAPHKNSQLFLDIIIRVLIIIVLEVRVGTDIHVKFIRLWRN